jgi:polyphosphate kinase
MPRNLYERVEVLCPLLDPVLQIRVKDEILASYLADNTKVRFLDRQGRYCHVPRRRGEDRFSSQDFLISLAEGTPSTMSIPKPVLPPAKTAPRKRPVAAYKTA